MRTVLEIWGEKSNKFKLVKCLAFYLPVVGEPVYFARDVSLRLDVVNDYYLSIIILLFKKTIGPVKIELQGQLAHFSKTVLTLLLNTLLPQVIINCVFL